MNHSITRSLTSLIETSLKLKKVKKITVKRVFNILVECLQNLDKHLDIPPPPSNDRLRNSYASLYENKNFFSILTANYIEKSKKESLEIRLSKLKNVAKPELRQLYKEQLSMGRISEKGGAGLGFIDMARKSGLPFEYHFIDIFYGYSIFIIIFKVSK